MFDYKSAVREFQKVEKKPSFHQLGSPFDLYSVETLRDKHKLRLPPTFATDVFLWGLGAPTKRHLTKISGLPYWPQAKPWPRDRSRQPLRFLAQICFLDSTDLVSKLPGDLLLFFVPNDDEWDCDPRIRLEWLKVADQPLIEELPKGVASYSTNEWHGVIHRAFDYPAAEKTEHDVSGEMDLAVFNGTKIGGVAARIQSPFIEIEADSTTGLPKRITEDDDDTIPGEFICQLTSIQAKPSIPYPWTNQSSPLSVDWTGRNRSLEITFGDMGSIYVFLKPNGKFVTSMESY